MQLLVPDIHIFPEREYHGQKIYDTMACGVVVWNAAKQVIAANAAAKQILDLSFQGLQTYIGSREPGIMVHLDGTPLSADEWLSAIIFETGEPVRNYVAGYKKLDGSCRWLQCDGTPVCEDDGLISQVVVSFIDVTDRVVAERRARESEERLQVILGNLPVTLYVIDRMGIITLLEGKGIDTSRFLAGETLATSVFDFYHNTAEALEYWQRALAGETFTLLTESKGRNFESRIMPVSDQNGEVTSIICVAIDVTERARAEKALLTREEHFRALTENMSDLVTVLAPDGTISYASPSHQRILGYDPASLIGRSILDFVPSENRERAARALRVRLKRPGSFMVSEYPCMHADGSVRIFEVIVNNQMSNPAVQGLIMNSRDITESKRVEEKLRYQALHDALTDLPNRTLLLERLQQALSATAKGDGVALLMLDLDRFKDINDTFGHQHGDLLLQQVAERLVQAARAAITVARLGGDEFALLLTVTDKEDALQTVRTIHTALEAPFTIRGYPLRVEASVGIVLYPQHGLDALTLLRRADMALYMAKRAHNGYAFYDAAFDEYSPRRLALIGALRNAIVANELMLYYQPKADARTGIVQGLEALLRWQHPIYDFVPPDQFIPLAEQTGLIGSLTSWVLQTALKQCRHWLRAGIELGISVNLSMWNLREESLPDTIAALLKAYCIAPYLLSIELTESAVMADTQRTLDVLSRLSALGVQISVDDFGTGYSSLFYLKRLPVNELKIDRSFVQHMCDVETDAAIVRSTIELAHSLGLNVVAEGVEDQATMQLLAALGCDTVQGYYLSRPLPPHDLERWLHETRPMMVS